MATLALLCSAPAHAAPWPGAADLHLFVLDPGPGATEVFRERVKLQGGRVRFAQGTAAEPGVVVAKVDAAAAAKLAAMPGVRLDAGHGKALDAAALHVAFAGGLDWVASYWETQVGDPQAPAAGQSPKPPQAGPSPAALSLLADDVVHLPGAKRGTGPMRGRIAVAVLLLDSDGTHDPESYDWSAADVSFAKTKMAEMATWWNTVGAEQDVEIVPAANHWCQVVPIGYEPLNFKHESTEQCLWMDDAMEYFGLPRTCEPFASNIETFNETLAGENGVEDAYTIFIAHDGDYNFGPVYIDYRIAWAAWGGPYVMMSRKNGAWGLDAMAMVAAHETGHIFHALDEYSQEGYATCECGGQSLGSGTWEYNGCKNDNCHLPSGYYCKTPHDICLMAEEQEDAWYDHHLCWSTTCHIGWVCKPESCDWVDNDCDGLTDEDAGASGCEWYWKDADGDWFGGNASDKKCYCSPQGDYRATKTGDCDDSNAAANPGAKEKCDGLDNDCDGTTDPDGSIGCEEGHPDADGDGYGADAGTACTCGGTSKQGGDCDDSNAAVNPKAIETCNGFDDDCDGKVDPKYSVGCVDTYQDADGDGYGGGKMSCLCLAPGQEPLTRGGDCADSDPAVHPGAEEVCNGIDDDCDGGIDEDLPGCGTSQPDAVGPEETPEEPPEEEAPGPEYDEDAIAGPEAEEEPVPSEDPGAQPNKGSGGCGAGASGAFPVALALLFPLLSPLVAAATARRRGEDPSR